MEDEINSLQLGFDIGAVLAQTSHWKNTKKLRERARSILIALNIKHTIADDPLFIFGLGIGCGHRHKFPVDKQIDGIEIRPES
jgi:hypothetical protein